MAYDIIIGRDESDKKKFGSKGLIYLGKGYVKMGQYTSLSNKIWLDVARNHVILVAGKRGSGKSYTLGVIAEELANLQKETSRNIATLMFDTIGVFWTMKYKNEKDIPLLKEWGLETKNLDIQIFIPDGKAEEYRKNSLPFDNTFALKPSELDSEDWFSIFGVDIVTPLGVLIENTISYIRKHKPDFTLEDIKKHIDSDLKSSHETKNSAHILFQSAENWGIFSNTSEGTEIKDIIKAGKTTVLDISAYSSITSFNVRALIISIISRKIFKSRLEERKKEEIQSIQHGQDYLSYGTTRENPLVWLFIDEAHEFLPKTGKTPATDALIQLLREGRQPGISMVLATQQPGEIHKDAMTQSDIVISHRVTAKPDVDALNEITQTYLLENIRQQMNDLPSLKGSAIILDDNSERIYPIRVRPRFTWHGGEAPASVKAESNLE